MRIHSGAPAARRATKRNTMTIGTGSHACIEIETHATIFSWLTWLGHGLRARAPNDDVTQHGGLTRVNTKSCSLGLQRIYLILDIHVMLN